jgi:hypothetical protein
MEILYIIVLCTLAFIVYLFSLINLIGQVKDEWVKDVFKDILARYLHILDAAIDPAAILWDPIWATIYTFLLLIKLSYQRKIGYIIRTLIEDKILLRKIGLATILWVLLTILAIYKLFVIYGLFFSFFILLILLEYKRLKTSYKTVEK